MSCIESQQFFLFKYKKKGPAPLQGVGPIMH